MKCYLPELIETLHLIRLSILGMNLFGCKFCEQINDEWQCDRKNFDSLLWALVTVFQVDSSHSLNSWFHRWFCNLYSTKPV